jgi:hypothetical protein
MNRGVAADTNSGASPNPAPSASGGELILENSPFLVSFDSGKGEFSIRHKPSGKLFIKNGTTGEGQGQGQGQEKGKACLTTMDDHRFGKMRAIRIDHEGGASESIALPENLPFVLFTSVIANPGQKDAVINHVPGVSADVDLGLPVSALKTLGTVGLRPPAGNPGSYAFLAVADPSSLNGVVGGWITQDRASGVVLSPKSSDGKGCRIEARSDYGRLLLKPWTSTHGETYVLGYFEDAREGLERYADAMATAIGVKLPKHAPGHCTWYMDKYGAACDEKHLEELASFAEKNLKPWGLGFLQIDDNWQSGTSTNGPKRNFMEHNPKGPYPSGMKATAAMIAAHGFTPGIWFIPFAGTWSDPFFQTHPDWFTKDEKGNPYEVTWGGTCFDMTTQGARDYLRGLVTRVTGDWGYKLLKLDGFWTGSATRLKYVNDGLVDDGMGDAVFSDPTKPNIEVMRDGVKLVRKSAGTDVFLLGCCISQNMRSLAGSVGLVDSMRVGPDTGAAEIGSTHASRLWFLNGRVWWNDPDCVSVRSTVSIDQARLNASFGAVSGGMFLNSDWIPDLPAERLDILRHCMPLHDLSARPVDVFEREPASVWHLADTRKEPRRDIVALLNWSKSPTDVRTTPAAAGLPAAEQYIGFDFWAGKFIPPFHDKIGGMMPAKSARVLAFRPVSQNPQLISTSRHVTQGIVDVPEEHWDASASALRGACDVVGNDPDELRIVVPVGPDSWIAGEVTLSDEDRKAGVTASLKQEGPRIRCTILSPVSRTVRWAVKFSKGAVTATPPPAVAGLKIDAGYRGATLTWDENGADLYRVTRNDGFTVETAEPRLDDRSASTFKELSYTIRAIGWDGSEGQPSSMNAPKVNPCPATPPLPTLRLDDLKALEVKNGYGKATPGKTIAGTPLKLNGKTYEHGIGAHAQALSVYAIPSGATRFVSVVGLDDKVKGDFRSSVVFQVYGDVKEMGEAPVLLAESPLLSEKTLRSWAFDLELNSRYKELRLVVTDAGDDINADLADWVDAGFITASKNQ